jgi:hypothetical protein
VNWKNIACYFSENEDGHRLPTGTYSADACTQSRLGTKTKESYATSQERNKKAKIAY